MRRWWPAISRTVILSPLGIGTVTILYVLVAIGIVVALFEQGFHGPVGVLAIGLVWGGRMIYLALSDAAAARSG